MAITYLGSSSTPTDGAAATNAGDPTSVTPVANMIAGDLCVIYLHSRIAALTQLVQPGSSGGQVWFYGGQRSTTTLSVRMFWCRFNGIWLTLNSDPAFIAASAICNTAIMHVFRPTTQSNDWAIDVAEAFATFAAPTTPFTVTITGVTPAQANTVSLAGWFSVDDNTYGNISGTGWVAAGTAQYRNVAGSDQSASFAYKIQTASGATGNVSKDQLTLGGDAGGTLIITFYEKATGSAPTRMYIPHAGAGTNVAAVTPVANGAYAVTTDLNFRHLASFKTGSDTAASSFGAGWTTGQLMAQVCAVSPPLRGAQTIAGTVKAQFRCNEQAATDNVFTRPELYVVSGDGQTVRGTLWAIGLAGPNTELNATNRNKTWFDGDSLSSVNALDGDRIVLKLGYTDVAGTTPTSGDITIGDFLLRPDCPEDETNTQDACGWIEFSQTIAFRAVVAQQITLGTLAATPATTATCAPPASTPMILCVKTTIEGSAGAAPTPTVAETGAAWTQICTVEANNGSNASCRLTVFVGIGGNPAATLTITAAGTTRISWTWLALPGATASGGGLSAVRQYKTSSSTVEGVGSGTFNATAFDVPALRDNFLLLAAASTDNTFDFYPSGLGFGAIAPEMPQGVVVNVRQAAKGYSGTFPIEHSDINSQPLVVAALEIQTAGLSFIPAPFLMATHQPGLTILVQ